LIWHEPQNPLLYLLVGEIGHALIVGFDFSHDLIAVGELISRLDDGREFWSTACAPGQQYEQKNC
jgi:hypothetical protein